MIQEEEDLEQDFPVYLSSDLDSDLEDNLMCFST